MFFPHGVTVTLKSTAKSVDDHGDETQTVTSSSWGPCAVAPRTSVEQVGSRQAEVITGLTVYGPTVTITAKDTLIINGLNYLVDGEPGVWQSPFTGWAPGIEVAVKRASDG